MADDSRRGRPGRGARGPLLRAAVLSALFHAAAIVLLLLAPHRLPSAPPTAYTVEIVDPGALGGKLLAGPIGGGRAAHRAPVRAPEPPAEPEPPRSEPEVVAKAEPAKPEPRDEDADTAPLGLARETPRRAPTARPTPKTPPSVAATTRPRASASPRSGRGSPVPTRTPTRGGVVRPSATVEGGARGAPTPAADLDSQLTAAIQGVESRTEKPGTPGLATEGRGGGMGGTERSLDRPPGVGGEGPGGGGTVRGLEFVVYYNQMLSRIKESWTYVGERADLQVTVRFTILDSGAITDIRLVERSGDPGYDASVERAVKRASPLGPPPEAYRKDFSDVELTFRPADLRRPSG